MSHRTKTRRLALAAGFAAFTSLGTIASEAGAEPIRILVAAANKNGLPAERPLRFSDNDAKRVRDVMVSLGGVRSEHAFLLAEPSRTALYGAIDRAKAVAQGHRAEEVTLLFYFSGHGDRESVHVGSDRILLSQLATKLGEVPAGLRIAITDACRSTRDKGFSADEPFTISATMVPQASGQVWLHASSDGEAAQESDELQGAIFTHAWLNGLRGAADANGDARVTLDESFAFAHSQTLIRSAKSSGVLQKPEAVVNLHETAPVVLTQTASAMATVALPPGKDTHFLLYSANAKSVLSELWSAPDRRLRLRLPPGRYVVQRRSGGAGAIAQITIAEGEERALEERDFLASPLEALARKGDGHDDDPPPRAAESPAPSPNPRVPDHELVVGYDSGWNSRTGLVHGPRVTYGHPFGRWALYVGGGAELSARDLATNEERLVVGYARGGVELRQPLDARWLLRAGAGVRGGIVSQTIVPLAPGPTETKATAALGPEIGAGLRARLGPLLFVEIAATAHLAFLREESTIRAVPAILGGGALGASF